jgi:hypothetical protein
MQRLFFLLIICLITSCKKTNENSVTPEEKFVFKEIVNSSSGFAYSAGKIPKQQLIIKTAKDWELLLYKMSAEDHNKGKLATKDISFDQYFLVVVIDEFKNSSGYQIMISDFVEYPDKIMLTIQYTSPKFTSGAANSQPFQVVKIHKTEKPIEFN